MTYFQQMSWGEAVDYVRSIAIFINLLVLSIPLHAFIAILRGKRTRPGETLVFAHVVLWTWLALLVGAIVYFFTGLWYGENGPEPQVMAARITIDFLIALAATTAIHAGLYWTARPKRPKQA